MTSGPVKLARLSMRTRGSREGERSRRFDHSLVLTLDEWPFHLSTSRAISLPFR